MTEAILQGCDTAPQDERRAQARAFKRLGEFGVGAVCTVVMNASGGPDEGVGGV